MIPMGWRRPCDRALVETVETASAGPVVLGPGDALRFTAPDDGLACCIRNVGGTLVATELTGDAAVLALLGV